LSDADVGCAERVSVWDGHGELNDGGFVTNVGATQRSQNLQVDAQVEALGNLTGEVDTMLVILRGEMERGGKASRAVVEPPAVGVGTPAKAKL